VESYSRYRKIEALGGATEGYGEDGKFEKPKKRGVSGERGLSKNKAKEQTSTGTMSKNKEEKRGNRLPSTYLGGKAPKKRWRTGGGTITQQDSVTKGGTRYHGGV